MEIEEFKNLILNYIGIQCGTDSEIYQEIVVRMQKLNVQKLSEEDYEHYYRQKVPNGWLPDGFYDPKERKVILEDISNLSYVTIETTVHECVHVVSHATIEKLGFKQYDMKLGNGFNEMATCYITSKILNKGNGGGYSRDYRDVFKFFLETTKMSDKELIILFFGKDRWLTSELSNRFDSAHPEALTELVQFYDIRVSKGFDEKRVLQIMQDSAKTNGILQDKNCKAIFDSYSDYWDLDYGR